jgi:hypothetical protein
VGSGGASVSVFGAGVIAGNQLVAGGGDSEPSPPGPLGSFSSSPTEFCLPQAAGGREYWSRVGAITTASPAEAPILRLDPTFATSVRLSVRASFVSGNIVALGSPFIQFDAGAPEAQIALIHNTCGPEVQKVLEERIPGFTPRLVSARNLFLSDPSVDLDEVLVDFEVTFDATPSGSSVWEAQFGNQIAGPSRPGTGDLPLLAAATVRAMSKCDRVLATCPEFDTCGELDAGGFGDSSLCPLGTAAEFVLDLSATEPLEGRWPWQSGELLQTDSPSQWNVPGAQGAVCRGAFDPVDYDPLSQTGDGDGFTTLTDCDNSLIDVQPSLPEHDGYSSEFCDPNADGDCYECPTGSDWPPPDDDAVDDDDDASDDDDALDDDDSTRDDISSACTASGCGVSYFCQDGGAAILPVALLPLARRRLSMPRRAGTR